MRSQKTVAQGLGGRLATKTGTEILADVQMSGSEVRHHVPCTAGSLAQVSADVSFPQTLNQEPCTRDRGHLRLLA